MKLRIAFDAGSSACVWAADDEARDALGTPPDLDLLGVRAKLLDEEDALCETYDEAFPWDDPTAPMTWSAAEEAEFRSRVADFTRKLRAAVAGKAQVLDVQWE